MTTLPTIRPDYWAPASRIEKLKFIAAVMLLPHREPVDQSALHALFFAALDGTTKWGLATSLGRIAKGDLGHGFCPSPSEARLLINAVMRPVVDAANRERQIDEQIAERRELQAMHQAKTPELKARVAALNAKVQGR